MLKKVNIFTGEAVKEIYEKGLITQGGKTLKSDFTVVAIGITPNVEIANKSGIKVDGRGIMVNEYLETEVEGIYAAGDVANIFDPIEEKRRIEHWNNAEYTGRLAARNMLGVKEKYNFLSTVWSDVFDLHIEAAGETLDYDDYVLRGKTNVENMKFVMIYLKGGVIRGYFAINVIQGIKGFKRDDNEEEVFRQFKGENNERKRKAERHKGKLKIF